MLTAHLEADPGGNLGIEHELAKLGFLTVLLSGGSLSPESGSWRTPESHGRWEQPRHLRHVYLWRFRFIALIGLLGLEAPASSLALSYSWSWRSSLSDYSPIKSEDEFGIPLLEEITCISGFW